MQKRLALRWKSVEASGDKRLDVVRHGDVCIRIERKYPTLALEDTPVGEHPDELLGVEGVAPGALQQSRVDLGRQHGLR